VCALSSACSVLGTVADLDVACEESQLVVRPVDEFGRYRWSFDTGSDLTLFDEDSLADVPLVETDAIAVITAMTGRKVEGPIEILDELLLRQRKRPRPFRLENLWVVRVPRLRENTGFDAILGYRPFRNRIVELDLGRERVRVRARAPGGRNVEHLPLTFDEWRPIVEVTSSTGYAFPAIVDTGSNSFFSLARRDLEALDIDRPFEAGRLTRGAFGSTTHALYQFDGWFSLGRARFQNPVVTGTRELSESLLGVPALRFVRMTIDPARERAVVDLPWLPGARLGLAQRGVTITSVVNVLENGPAPVELPRASPSSALRRSSWHGTRP
jgi:hypothetical protein